jgi:hypothetical protein
MIELALATMISCETPSLTRGWSGEAIYVSQQSEQARKRLRDTYAIGWGGNDVFSDLEDVVKDCSLPGWDGYSAEPIAPETHDLASEFLKALPIGTPVPTVSADPDGQITFEWYKSPRRTVSVSVSPDGDLHFASLVGSKSLFGIVPFYGQAPNDVLELVHRLKAA